MQELKIIIWIYTVQIITYVEDWKGKSFVRKLLIIPVWYWTALKDTSLYYFMIQMALPIWTSISKKKRLSILCNKYGLSTHSQKCTSYWTSAHVSEYLPDRCCFKGQEKLRWNICSYKHKHIQCWINTQQQIIITLTFGLPCSTKA